MPHRIFDVTGWGMWASGTAATWLSQERIAALGLAIAGLIVVVGNASIKLYQDVRVARREQDAEDFRLELDRQKCLSTYRHDQLTDELATIKVKLDATACPFAGDGQARCHGADHPLSRDEKP